MLEPTNANLKPHFFVTTLGLAEKINAKQPHGLKTIIDLLRLRAALSPLEPAVAMAQPDPEKPIVYTYSQLLRAVSAWCEKLTGYLPPAVEVGNTGSGPVVGVLSENSWDLMMCFLALIRMGYTALLIAPQCDAPAVRHLLVETSATLLIASKRYFDLGTASTTASHGSAPCECRIIPNSEASDVDFLHNWWPSPKFITSSTISHIHHTSGTTSGLPKPIPQPHAISTVHLPCLPPKPMVATFTTTPLYHGGVADFFRSFMSGSLIWLYPGNLPITADNIVKLIDTANSATKIPVKLFTGVPWVQRECSESPSALDALRKMDMVGYGGASMPENVGYKLVRNGVKLVSRFGSTEMGFLMSSYRDFETDTAYDYLRVPYDEKRLIFERQPDGDYELVVRSDWPFMAKRNRPDGSWATSDLFAPSPHAPKTSFKYLTRNDSTIVLMNGKKFNPMVIEDGLRALESVEEAVVFGQNKEYPGVLVFLTKKEISGGMKTAITEIMNKINLTNKQLPNYAKIPQELTLIFSNHSGWPKNSKGMPLRGMVEKKYAMVIEKARQKYETGIQNSQDASRISIEDPILLQERLSKIVSIILGRQIDDTEDFFSAGVDSTMATLIRRKILGEVKVKSPLPMNVVFEQRNIAGLVDFLTSDRHADEKHEAELKEMRRLVEQININRRSTPPPEAQVVVLTGATGALGSHVLSNLIKSGVKRIFCLVRQIEGLSFETRIMLSLKARKLDAWDPKLVRVDAIHANFHLDYLGMSKESYTFIAKHATTIIHCAWPVNFLVPLGSFDQAIHGVENLLSLANNERRKRFIFCSSTASVIQTKGTIREELSTNPEDANPLGYSRSKWVAENIVKQMGGDVIRLGQLSGDTQVGIWNSEEGWPSILKTVGIVGSLPVLHERIEWLPVDIAARAVVNIAMAPQGVHGSGVWHVLNKCPVMWSDVLDAMEKYCGKFNRVEPKEWLRQLEDEETKGVAIKLLSFWKDAYGSKTESDEAPKSPDFEVVNTAKVFPGFERGFALGPDYLSRVFTSLGIQRREPMVPN